MFTNYEKHRQKLMAKFAKGQSILDIGCAQMPNRNLKAKRIVGLDLEEMKVQAPYTQHIVGDVTEIDTLLGGEKFDTVLMGECIEHVEQPYDILRSVHNSIAPDGSIILSTPNPLGIPVVIAEYLKMRKYYYTQHHVYYFTPRWVWRLLERSGYKVTKTIGCGANLAGRWSPAPASLSYIVIYIAKPV